MKHLLLILTCLISFQTISQTKLLKDVSGTKQMSVEVTTLFKQNKINEAFQILTPYWPIPENEIETLKEKIIKYTNIISTRFGAPFNYLKVKDESIGDIAKRETYLIQYENKGVRLIFTYYKNKNGWIVNAFKWDDNFTEEFVTTK